MIDFEKARIRSRIEAALLDAAAKRPHPAMKAWKQRVLGAMEGTVVELGPGTGTNMAFYGPGVKVIGIEPNPAMHGRLREEAERHGVDLEIRTLRGESIDVGDDEADAVVATLVLCGVDDPGAVVGEVQRVLKPGGTYFFLEHVVAEPGTWTRRAQGLLKRPHRWMFNGCEVDRDTTALLRNAGFADIELDEVDLGLPGLHARTQIVGAATL